VPYAYYARLKTRQQAIYRRSDAVVELTLACAATLQPLVSMLVAALSRFAPGTAEVPSDIALTRSSLYQSRWIE
jgi:hypothetical protein